MRKKRANALTGMTGVHFVAAELGLRGFIATETSRNAPGADILCVSQDLRRPLSIQVKANKPGGTMGFWLLSKRAMTDVAPSHFYVFVNLKAEGRRPDYYIVRSRSVAKNTCVERTSAGTWYTFPRRRMDQERWDLLAE